MSSEQAFVDYVCEQLRGAGAISSKRMFGEAAVYLQDKVVAMVCDNQLFIKPTAAGRALLGAPAETPPFPGAKGWFLLADLDDPEYLAQLVRITADALPAPPTKKAAARKKGYTKARAPRRRPPGM